MQLYALKEKIVVSADDAEPGKNYNCPYSRNPLRLRAGRFKIRHFYHYKTRRKCLRARKNSSHLATQLLLLRLLPKNEAEIEVRFPEVGRIADVVWEPKKIIFEIQCSRITLIEAKKREADYAQMGYDVIWILSDSLFNKRRPTPAEIYIRCSGGYFSSSNRILLYDQFEVFDKGRRLFKTHRCMIKPRFPKLCQNNLPPNAPRYLRERYSYSKYYFKGDLTDRSMKSDKVIKSLNAIDKQMRKNPITLWNIIKQIVRIAIKEYLEKQELQKKQDDLPLF